MASEQKNDWTAVRQAAHDPEDARDVTEEEKAAFLEPPPVVSASGMKDPAENPEGWHLCRDLIDPLANELQAWLQKSEFTVEDVDSLQFLDVGVNGVGPDAYVNAWSRARVELDVKVSSEYRRTLEHHVRGLAQGAREVLRRLDELPPDDDNAHWRDVEIQSFAVQVVEPCLRYLRDLSGVLKGRQRRLAAPAAPVKGAGEGEQSRVGGRPEVPPANTRKAKRGKKADAEKAIRHYVVDRQSYYDSLKPGCQQHEVAARKQAEGMFSRNRLAKKLGLSAGLVSNTDAWKQIKADLFPDRPCDLLSKLRHSGGKVGFDIAEERAGQARGNQTFDAVVRNETRELIRAANLPEAAADQMVNQLEAGEITDADARETLDFYRDGEASRLADIEAEHQRPRKRRRNCHSDR